MMIRVLLLLLVAGTFARASDPLPAPKAGNSATVTQPHITAELIPDFTAIRQGKPFDVALHLHADPGWHTYWINPGDAGLATNIAWTLPPAFTAGPIRWPAPEKHAMGPLVTYGYGGDVYLLTMITPPAERDKWPLDVEIKAKARWLVCQEECIPGQAVLTFQLNDGATPAARAEDNLRAKFFAAAEARMPVDATDWAASADYYGDSLSLRLETKTGTFSPVPSQARFFPEQPNILSNLDADNSSPNDAGKPLADGRTNAFRIQIKLQQNGDKPDKLSGVLVSDRPLIGDDKAVYISEFPVTSAVAAPGVAAAVPSGGSAPPSGGPDNSLSGSPQATGSASQPAASEANSGDGPKPPLQAAPPLGTAAATAESPSSAANQPLLIAVLGAAFIGGLILNLMPCVLPVLALKVFSLIKHSGENPKAAWIQGVAFTAGVVLSFWLLAGLLLALRAAGNQIGWGFQMQSPGFVLGLILLFFLLALNLFGVFELGSSLVGLDAKATGRLGGLASSFGNGALATLAATPCTAPFMGSALGFAAQQPAIISLLIFTFLALGMATPYLLLTVFPGALRLVPKPGAWMEAFKQFMGFLLMATVIFLVYVFGALVGEDQVPWLLFVLLIAGLGAWIYGRWSTPVHTNPVRFAAFIVAFGLLAYAIDWGATLARANPGATVATTEPTNPATPTTQGTWQPWSQAAVNQTLSEGKPVFVDFTAAWCLSCKVNEAVALNTDAVKQAFAQKSVALFRADWTHSDPEISNALRQYNRDGVPLYLLYSPKSKDKPQVLPEALTPGTVLSALNEL